MVECILATGPGRNAVNRSGIFFPLKGLFLPRKAGAIQVALWASEMTMDLTILGAVTLFAALAQSATGFGFAIVAVPLYLLVLNSHAAVQLAILVTPVISVTLLWRLGSHLHKALLIRLVAGTALGLPMGMAAFFYASLTQLKLAVALLIVVFSGLFMVGMLRGRVDGRGNGRSDGWAGGRGGSRPPPLGGDIAAGLVSGAMTTSLGMPGPPAALYLSAVGLDKDASRATILTLFLFSYSGAIAMQAVVVGIGVDTWRLAAEMIPFVLVGSIGGHYISGRMSQGMFRIATLLLLLATGFYTLYATLTAG